MKRSPKLKPTKWDALVVLAVLLLALGVLPQATVLNLRLPEEDLSRLGEEILFILPRQIFTAKLLRESVKLFVAVCIRCGKQLRRI